MKTVAMLALLLLFARAAFSNAEYGVAEKFADDIDLGEPLQDNVDNETDITDFDENNLEGKVEVNPQCTCISCYRYCKFRFSTGIHKCFYSTKKRCSISDGAIHCYHYRHPMPSHPSCTPTVPHLPSSNCPTNTPVFCVNHYNIIG